MYPVSQAFTTMFWLTFIAVQAFRTWLFTVTMLITDLATHSTRGEHDSIDIFCWHFHRLLSLSEFYLPAIRNLIFVQIFLHYLINQFAIIFKFI